VGSVARAAASNGGSGALVTGGGYDCAAALSATGERECNHDNVASPPPFAHAYRARVGHKSGI
jgi:hypothetical protein